MFSFGQLLLRRKNKPTDRMFVGVFYYLGQIKLAEKNKPRKSLRGCVDNIHYLFLLPLYFSSQYIHL